MTNRPKSSGKFVLRIRPELHKQLKALSMVKGVSLNAICNQALEESLQHGKNSSTNMTGYCEEIISWWRDKILGIVLFGSVARGEEDATSDIDLLLIMKSDLQISRELYRDWDTFLLNTPQIKNLSLSPQFVTLPEDISNISSLWLEVAVDGIVLWEKDLSISMILSKIRRKITEGFFIRSETHGQGYWKTL